jgi:hypothetical protein
MLKNFSHDIDWKSEVKNAKKFKIETYESDEEEGGEEGEMYKDEKEEIK